MKRYDVIVIGAGHNGLIAAAYLARAGRSVCVLERNGHPGGSLINLEFHPNFLAPAGAHTVSLMGPHIMRDLDLMKHGLDILPVPGRVSFHQDGDYVATYSNDAFSKAEMRRWSARDAESFDSFERLLQQQRTLIAPSLKEGMGHPVDGLPRSVTDALKHMGDDAGYDIAGFWLASMRDVLARYFETDIIQAHMAGPALLGSARGAYAPGTAYLLLHQRLAANAHGVKGFVKGGPQALSRALVNSVEEAGGEIMYHASVSQANVDKDHITDIVTDDGQHYTADQVLSNLDFKRTFFTLFDWKLFPDTFKRRLGNHRMSGSTAKLNIALDGLPTFNTVPSDCPALRGTLHFAQSLDEIEQASDAWADGLIPERPVLEVAIPSQHDASLAPPDKHVMSVYVQYVPQKLFDGVWDEGHRQSLIKTVIDQIADYSPNLKDLILATHLSVPTDLEEMFAFTAGDIHHGEMALDQLLFQRPMPGLAEMMPFAKNLHLCGAGTHPGGGITGVPGYLSAQRVLHAAERRSR